MEFIGRSLKIDGYSWPNLGGDLGKLDGVLVENGGVWVIWPLVAEPCRDRVVFVELHDG